MAIEIVLEMHQQSEDNASGHASGWGNPGLTEEGRRRSAELGRRRRNDGITACFTSDLKRAAECAAIAFDGTDVPVLHDWRLRETDYGQLNRAPVQAVFSAVETVTESFPGGESWQQAADRVGRFLDDLPLRWDGRRICVVGHIATLWGFHQRINGRTVAEQHATRDPYVPGVEFVLRAPS